MSPITHASDVPAARIEPMLSVRRGRQALDFYQAAFDAAILFRMDGDDDSVVAQLSVAGARFWVADESPLHANFSPETVGGSTTRMVLIVDDPHAVHARALAAGATQVLPVGARHGWLIGRVLDPFGHHWENGKPD